MADYRLIATLLVQQRPVPADRGDGGLFAPRYRGARRVLEGVG